MNVLMIGDVVAKPGRVAVLERIQDLREQHAIDIAIMNAENVAGGFSMADPPGKLSTQDSRKRRLDWRGEWH